MEALRFKIRQRRSEECRRKVLGLRLLHFSEHKTFDKMRLFIVTAHVQRVYATWLASVGHMFALAPRLMPTARDVLSAYMIHGFPDDVLGTTRNPLETKMIAVSSDLVRRIQDPSPAAYHKLLRALTTYKTYFKAWLMNDQTTQLEILGETYDQARQTKEALETKAAPAADLAAIGAYLASIRKQAVKIAGPKGARFIESFQDLKKTRAARVYATVDAIAKKAFWDHVARDLAQKPPRWSTVLTILGEARDLLSVIARRDKEQIHDVLNMGLFEQMVKYDVFTLPKIHEVLVYLMDKIKEYGPPSQDAAVAAWKDEVATRVTRETPQVFLPQVLAQVMHRLTSIEKSKQLVEGLYKAREQAVS